MKAFVPPEDVSEERRQRSEAATRRFDRQHDAAQFADAQARYRAGDLRGCAQVVERLLARSADHFEARLLMAEVLLAEDRPGEAAMHLETALAAHPSDARLHHLMGLALDAMGQRADALVYYEQATRLQPNDEVYAASYEALAAESGEGGVGSGELGMGSGESRTGNGEGDAAENERREDTTASSRAPRVLQSASSAPLAALSTPDSQLPTPDSELPTPDSQLPTPDSQLPTPDSQLPTPDSQLPSPASSLRPRPQADWQGPVEAAGSPAGNSFVTDAVDGSAPELLERGESALAQGAEALAFDYFRQAMAVRPDDPGVAVAAAVSALGHNEPDVAVALLEPLLEVFCQSVTIRRVLGTAYYRLGEYDSSQVVLQQALSLDKSCGLSYFLMGCTLAKLGQLTAAETHFRQARRLDPRYTSRR
jgi:tetratricopeptide (TPR) repeat protein